MTENLYDFNKSQNESDFDQLVRVSVDKLNKLHNKDWTDIREESNFEHSSDNLRKYARGFKLMIDNGYVKANVLDEVPNHKNIVEIKGDGSQTSDKLIRISEDDMKNPNKLLEAHGFNPKEWELVNAKNSMWNRSLDTTLHSSKISVKPKVNGFDIEQMLEFINKSVKPISIEKVENIRKGGLLEIPLVDMHFGINSYESYRETQLEIIELIQSKSWDAIYFNIGNDLLHNDNFIGQTSSGTYIEQVDMEKAWSDAFLFYTELINVALENSDNVNADYICGNHDKVITYGFVKSLEVKFPQVKFDSTIKNKKLFVWEKVAIFSAHGDKGSNRLTKALHAEHGKTIALCDTVEIHTGHLHYSQSKDDHGIVTRTLPTKAITDEWHSENSFVGSQKSFQIFEYTESKLKTIYHV